MPKILLALIVSLGLGSTVRAESSAFEAAHDAMTTVRTVCLAQEGVADEALASAVGYTPAELTPRDGPAMGQAGDGQIVKTWTKRLADGEVDLIVKYPVAGNNYIRLCAVLLFAPAGPIIGEAQRSLPTGFTGCDNFETFTAAKLRSRFCRLKLLGGDKYIGVSGGLVLKAAEETLPDTGPTAVLSVTRGTVDW